MPRIRTIKPDFFTSDTVSALPIRARLTWIGLWTHCDDHGRCRDNVKLIKAGVWPLDDISLRDVESDIKDLEAAGVVFRYAVGGKGYLQVTNWAEHQKVDRPSKSAIPPPSNGSAPAGQYAPEPRGTDSERPSESSRNPREDSPSPRGGKGREGKGREGERARGPEERALGADRPGPEPPSRCPEHIKERRPPACGQCADARKAHADWEAERNRRIEAAARCARHAGELAHNCRACLGEAKGAR